MVVAAHKLYSAANFIYPLDRRPFPFSSLLISLDVGHSPGAFTSISWLLSWDPAGPGRRGGPWHLS